MQALDLFAGAGGWDVACRWLDIESAGVEIMPAAIATREANGLHTTYLDVWDGLVGDDPHMIEHDLQIASPPCQTFSMAGRGAGRAALDDVLGLIHRGAYVDGSTLLVTSAHLDPRTALVLTPLAQAWRDRPTYIAWEQVPTVLPVWEACAAVLRSIGYSVWVGKLHAEQYGVPQTRIRAVLIARRDGITAGPPTPTHSRYHVRDPKRMDEGVLPWVSMAQALGWGFPTDTLRSNYGTSGDPANRGERSTDQPAPTLTSKAGRNRWQEADRGMTEAEAAALQSFPSHMSGAGSTSTIQRPRSTDEPSHTITGVATAEFHSRAEPAAGPKDRAPGGRRITPDEAAVLQSFPNGRGLTERPAPTITGGGTETGGAEPIAKWGRYVERGDWLGDPSRLTDREAAILQTFPVAPEVAARIASSTPFVFRGTKGQRFLQIGNAVPPLLAFAILGTFFG